MAGAALEKLKIRELKYQYCFATDAIDIDALLDTFTEDGYLEIEIFGSAEGHEGIREYLDWFGRQEFELRAHNVFNPMLSLGDDIAEGTWYYLVIYELVNGTLSIGHGEYSDVYVKTDDGWKISSLIARRRISATLPTAPQ